MTHRIIYTVLIFCVLHETTSFSKRTSYKLKVSRSLNGDKQCSRVCLDLPTDDKEPVCMIYSRYKTDYLFFVNLCHARRLICRENIVLHMVHPSRCLKSKLFFMPII
ncbi:unnamed protein product [Leptidea sinapis]|uniref:Kazal-like domain-containing protein n=1 Tax=Leptidea sinapis TaxID=189913 RepID=A0A5E4PN36_9NEOP|nr:unnamed protein product [Leptidea sinapis]